jgi:hypothetical protein
LGYEAGREAENRRADTHAHSGGENALILFRDCRSERVRHINKVTWRDARYLFEVLE